MLNPLCLTVDASYKLCNAAINKKYSPVIISSCKDLQILKVPVIPNHCCPAKGGSGCPRKRRFEKDGVLDHKKIIQNQARAEKSAILDGDVASPAIDSFNAMTCPSCGGKMHNKR